MRRKEGMGYRYKRDKGKKERGVRVRDENMKEIIPH
jgi:hypothetical protein